MEGRIVSPHRDEEDQDVQIRPQSLTDFIGQKKLKANLKIYMEAAINRGEPLDHVLLYGPPGLGKTTLAHIIAHEMKVNIRLTSGPAIEKPGDLAAILTNLEEGDVFFIDEIHRLSRMVEEILYPAMEDFSIDIVVGKGPGARSLRLDLPPFTLVGATTRAGLLTSPLRDRFGVINRLEYYDEDELTEIAFRTSSVLQVKISPEGALEVARRSRGTPRVTNRFIRRIRDYAQIKAKGMIDGPVALEGLKMLEVDPLGLDALDRKIIFTIIQKYEGGPVGLSTLAASISEERETIEDVYEPFLLQLGFIKRTPRGRVATSRAYEHFHLTGGKKDQPRLFNLPSK